MAKHLILGAAGHIDHGKTSLIRALTGVDTDRLPEEQRRGITIDLGFAQLDLGEYQLGVIDVPGHERFVSNMLAGAAGMDIALLAIAADDSIKPQTREHFDILQLLDLSAGVIALTKCDLAEPAWLDLVEEEIRELTAGTFLAEAPIVRTSAAQGTGLEELRQALQEAASLASNQSESRREEPFRLPIDRAFTIAGHGAVVTGSIASGQIQVGDTLQVEPAGLEVRVRGLQNHDRETEQASRGQRVAVNLAGVRHDQLGRGQELATPGHLAPSKLLTVEAAALPAAGKGIKDRSRVRLHLGSGHTIATIRLLDSSLLRPADRGWAQLYLAEPVAALWGQPFVLRSESPVTTIGGGRVIDPTAIRLRKLTPAVIQRLEDWRSSDETKRASAAAYFAQFRLWRFEDLSRNAGVEDVTAVAETLLKNGELIRLPLSPTRSQLIHRQVLSELTDRVTMQLEVMHHRQPMRLVHEQSQLVAKFAEVEPAVLNAALELMRRDGRLRRNDRGVGLTKCGPQLSTNEHKLLDRLLERFRTAGIEPPTLDDCVAETPKNKSSVPQIVELLTASGDLVEVAAGHYLHADVDTACREKLRPALETAGLTVSQVRELLGSSRKYVVPYCEYLDRSGFTKRQGDVRVLAEAAS